MGGLSQAHAKQLLDHLLTSTSYTSAAGLDLALFEVGHGDTPLTEADLAGNELAVAGYSRQTITFAAAADGEADRGAISKSSNAQTFTASAGSQAADAWAIYDDTSGDLLWWGELGDTAAVIDTGGYTIAAGDIACHIGAAGLTAYASKKLLDHSLGVASYTQPDRYLAIYATGASAPVTEDDLSGNELAGSGYARKAVTWSAAASSGDGGQSSNGNVLFDEATGTWATADAWAVVDASTAGNALAFSDIDTPFALSAGLRMQAAAAALTISLGPT